LREVFSGFAYQDGGRHQQRFPPGNAGIC
jgi:hypothetical protein